MLGKLVDLRRRQEQGQILAAAPRTAGEWLEQVIDPTGHGKPLTCGAVGAPGRIRTCGLGIRS
ncbi:hypothetical protein [Micromonospora sp. NPDC048839]|uniref:hypothetical protein n=1 Tax=Micromonospora sp. NPDC048839 TaxID=3155641 RepID=UPI0033FC20E6